MSLIILITIGGTGLFLFITGLMILLWQKSKKENCVNEIYGTVIKYSYLNEAPAPIAEYEVNGKVYRKKRYFQGIITTTSILKVKDGNGQPVNAYIDENDIIHIRKIGITSRKRAAETLYPLGSKIKIFYNPKNPKQAYVEKKPDKPLIVGTIYIYLGIIIMIGAIIISIWVR